jgi:hypothetical protein
MRAFSGFSRMPDQKTVRFTVYMSEDLRTRFKAKCVLQGATMNETLVRLVEDWTNQEEPPAKRGKEK